MLAFRSNLARYFMCRTFICFIGIIFILCIRRKKKARFPKGKKVKPREKVVIPVNVPQVAEDEPTELKDTHLVVKARSKRQNQDKIGLINEENGYLLDFVAVAEMHCRVFLISIFLSSNFDHNMYMFMFRFTFDRRIRRWKMIKQETIMEFSLKGALIERKRCI